MARMSADDRRELLVQAAIRVMAREGVANATTRGIVTEAGMPLGVFHYCFRSKEELLELVMIRINETSFEAVIPALSGDLPFEEALHTGLRAYWAHIEQDPAPHQLTYELSQYALRSLPEAARHQYAVYYELTSRFLAQLAGATSHAWIVPLPAVARCMLALIEGVTFQWLVDRDSEAALETLKYGGDALILLARPA